MFKKLVFAFVSLAGLLISSTLVLAAEQDKLGPPYPDVWGYDLSTLSAIKWNLASVTAYTMDDGDVWFLVTQSYKTLPSMDSSEKHIDSIYRLIKFFKGENTELSEVDLKGFFEVINKQKNFTGLLFKNELTFSDGSKLQANYRGRGVRGFNPDLYSLYYLKTEAQGQEKKYSILAGATQVEMHFDGGHGEIEGPPFYYKKLYTLGSIIPLRDDTFIVFENGGNLILRFNKDFKTKFKPVTPIRIQGNYINRNFFVIDYSLIEELESKAPQGGGFQSIHDGLLEHFHEKYKSK